MAGMELAQSASEVGNRIESVHNTKLFFANGFDGGRCVDRAEAVLPSKRRRESLLNLVTEVRALIRELLQNRKQGVEVLVQYVCRGFCVSFLAWLQKAIARKVVFESRDVRMTGAGFSNT